MHDVIVVGARCSGSVLAKLLAEQGASVLLVDRATFPSDVPQGHFIHRHGPARLQRWGLLESIAKHTPAISSLVYDAGDFPLVARDLVEDGVAWGYGPRRSTLDKILVDAAVAAGVGLREGFSVDEYLAEDGRIAGIRGHRQGSEAIEERARLVVGADGRHSSLARAVQAQVYNQVPPVLGYYFTYWSDVKTEEFELFVRDEQRRVVFSFKTEDDLLCTFIGFAMDDFAAFRQDIEGSCLATFDTLGDFGERIRAGRRAERFYGASDLVNFYRKPFGPGWALVGDAGLHKDPFMALGICDGLRDAELLAEAIGEGLGGIRPFDEALAGYETRRNEASAADYQENLAAARFVPMPPEVRAVRAAVKSRPEDATLLIKARMGMIDASRFFNPANMGRLLGGAEQAPP